MNEAIKYLEEFCEKYGLTLELEGECGIGRECVGIIGRGGNNYVDFNPLDKDYEYDEKYFDEDLSPPDHVNNYHKHDCLAVLGRGETAILQLADWIRHLESKGKIELVERPTGATGIQALVSGFHATTISFVEKY